MSAFILPGHANIFQRAVFSQQCKVEGRRRVVQQLRKRSEIAASATDLSGTSKGSNYDDDGTRVVPVVLFIHGTSEETVKGVYAIIDDNDEVMYVGMSRDVAASLEAHASYHPEEVSFVRVMTFAIPTAREMKLVVDAWIMDNETMPLGNAEEWYEVDEGLKQQVEVFTPLKEGDTAAIRSPFESNVLESIGTDDSDDTSNSDEDGNDTDNRDETLELTIESVDTVLNDVRPYLISDGGNISVVRVDAASGRVELRLEGACGSCASAATTMHLGVEKALRKQFGGRVGEIVAVDEPTTSDMVSIDRCEAALDSIRDVLHGLGAQVSVLEVDEDEVVVSYSGPNNLKLGVEQTLLERIGGVEIVTFE